MPCTAVGKQFGFITWAIQVILQFSPFRKIQGKEPVRLGKETVLLGICNAPNGMDPI